MSAGGAGNGAGSSPSSRIGGIIGGRTGISGAFAFGKGLMAGSDKALFSSKGAFPVMGIAGITVLPDRDLLFFIRN
jgi:hypothetical protein